MDAAGQPTPGPFKFWSVTMAASIRWAADALSLPVGKDTAILGLLVACPAATLAFKSAMNVLRSGGQEQGILMLLIPMQLPVPSGLCPAVTPNCGTNEASTPPAGAGAAGAGAGAAGAATGEAGAGAGGAVPA